MCDEAIEDIDYQRGISEKVVGKVLVNIFCWSTVYLRWKLFWNLHCEWRQHVTDRACRTATKSVVIWAVAIAGLFVGDLMAFGLSRHVFYLPVAFFSFGFVTGKLVETSAHRVSLVAP